MPLACCVHWVGHGQRKENEGKCNCMCQWTQRGELRSVISVSIHWNLSLSVSWTDRYHRFCSKVVYDFCSRALFLSLVDMHLGTSLCKTPSDFSSALRNCILVSLFKVKWLNTEETVYLWDRFPVCVVHIYTIKYKLVGNFLLFSTWSDSVFLTWAISSWAMKTVSRALSMHLWVCSVRASGVCTAQIIEWHSEQEENPQGPTGLCCRVPGRSHGLSCLLLSLWILFGGL